MGIRWRPPQTSVQLPQKPPKGSFFFADREFPRVKWWTRRHMRHLYIYMIVLILTNTANGEFTTLPPWNGLD